jgi:hypothetical protein
MDKWNISMVICETDGRWSVSACETDGRWSVSACRVNQPLVFYVVLYLSLFDLLFFLLWPIYSLWLPLFNHFRPLYIYIGKYYSLNQSELGLKTHSPGKQDNNFAVGTCYCDGLLFWYITRWPVPDLWFCYFALFDDLMSLYYVNEYLYQTIFCLAISDYTARSICTFYYCNYQRFTWYVFGIVDERIQNIKTIIPFIIKGKKWRCWYQNINQKW